ncbi:hypothetical protein B0H67DRAFT_581296 [Lasiosphaeris hirsuta]|uniref:Pentatricopeptide repeat-containing protein n=1 Tax=Lasiosphaeris hirsuta TaxID=260670 RepID=A0AA40AH00_9PEZI|nr:hypothetical protein B0H67DRAFT_581296 [Lasiosphaeris hirsuta]
MLERTAASIEPCSLQRVLPTVTRSSLRSRARLHNTFWYHGATALELDDACRALDRLPPSLRCSDAVPTQPEPSTGADVMTASAFLLDFLYPNGAAALLRKLRPDPLSMRPELGYRVASIPPRFYTSFGPDNGALSTNPGGEGLRDAANTPVGAAPTTTQPSERLSDPAALQRFLNLKPGQANDAIWQLYSGLEQSLQDRFRLSVLDHLAPSTRLEDAARISKLFAILRPAEWTDISVAAAVKAKLLELDLLGACAIWRAAVHKAGIVGGVDHILAFAFRTTDWTLILDVLEMFVPSVQASGYVVKFELLAKKSTDFKKSLERLYFYIQKMTSYNPRHALRFSDILNDFVTYLAQHSLAAFGQMEACYILRCAKHAASYQAYIQHCIMEGHWTLAASLYRLYRGLPGVHIPLNLIHAMVDVFRSSDDDRGMEAVLHDWYRVADCLTREGYQKYVAFYANRGDIKEVKRLVKEYENQVLGGPADPKRDDWAISGTLHAYAIRGEPKYAQREFDTFTETWGDHSAPTILWNNLLHSYARAEDYQGTVDTFSHILEAGNADVISYGTVMLQAGARGELQLTMQLFKMAVEDGIQWNVAMADSLVEAYCQNDRYEEAEQLCQNLSKNHTADAGDRAEYWNTLIKHHANRRDLAAVNRLLATMTAQDVAYNNDTYRNLLLALVNCRQSHHALHFVKVARREGVFKPTIDHYIMLLSAFLETREPLMAFHVKKEMEKAGLPQSAQSITKILESIGDLKAGLPGVQILKALQLFVWAAFGPESNSPAPLTVGMYAKIIFLLTRMRATAKVDELLEIFCFNFPQMVSSHETPTRLLESIMRADFYDKKYDRARKTWNLVFERACASAKQVLVPGVAPGNRFGLCDACKTMQLVYFAEGNADGLVALINQVTAAGFSLDSKNWNYYVQSLARMNKWKEAFRACEEMLMPNWKGWAKVRAGTNIRKRLPLETRRLGSNPQIPRPISYTLLILSREYLELERKMLWSNEITRLVRTINDDCPLTVNAITTMVWDSLDTELLNTIETRYPPGVDHIPTIDVPAVPARSPKPGMSIRDVMVSPSSVIAEIRKSKADSNDPDTQLHSPRRFLETKLTSGGVAPMRFLYAPDRKFNSRDKSITARDIQDTLSSSMVEEFTEDGFLVSAKSQVPTAQETENPAEMIRRSLLRAESDQEYQASPVAWERTNWEDVPKKKALSKWRRSSPPKGTTVVSPSRRATKPARDEFAEDGFLVSAKSHVPGPQEDPADLIRQAMLGESDKEK